jgi:hypothetical protein
MTRRRCAALVAALALCAAPRGLAAPPPPGAPLPGASFPVTAALWAAAAATGDERAAALADAPARAARWTREALAAVLTPLVPAAARERARAGRARLESWRARARTAAAAAATLRAVSAAAGGPRAAADRALDAAALAAAAGVGLALAWRRRAGRGRALLPRHDRDPVGRTRWAATD